MRIYPSVALTLVFLPFILSNDLTDITDKVFSVTNVIPSAFGDFNSDKLTDLIALKGADGVTGPTAVQVFLASAQTLSGISDKIYFKPGKSAKGKVLECRAPEGEYIRSVIPADFDGDGGMDLLIVYESDSDSDLTLTARIAWGEHFIKPNDHRLLCPSKQKAAWHKEITGLYSEPLVFDYDGDYTADILTTDADDNRIVYQFNGADRSNPVVNITLSSLGDKKPAKLKSQHSNAHIDLNGDGAADLFVTTQEGMELYENTKTGGEDGYKFHSAIPWPKEAVGGECTVDQCVGQAVFADFDLSGTLDLIIPMCFDPKCSNSSIYLINSTKLWDLPETGSTWSWVPMSLDLGNFRFLPPVTKPSFKDPKVSPLRLLAARVGDVDLDGFPDIMMTLYNISAGIDNYRSHLLLNAPCGPLSGCSPFWRQFQVQPGYTQGMNNNTILSTFFDLYENGRQDLIGVELTQNSGYRMSAFTNTTQDSDAYFIKVIVLTGVCYHNCRNDSVYVPYGTNSGGQTVRYQSQRPGPETFDEFQSVAVQMAQTSHYSLQLPYTIFGLGMAPNFVDFLEVSVANKTHSWPQIIPNSQLFVLPYPPSDPAKWEAKLFLYPGKSIIYTGLALVGTCAFVVLIILALHIRERRQDQQAKLQEANRFHFDAM